MSTTFIRWANRAGFEIRHSQIDATTDDVEILDYAIANPECVYLAALKPKPKAKRTK